MRGALVAVVCLGFGCGGAAADGESDDGSGMGTSSGASADSETSGVPSPVTTSVDSSGAADSSGGGSSGDSTGGASEDETGSTGGGGPPPVMPSPGCGSRAGATGAISGETTMVGGVERSYDMFVPEPYDAETPHAVIFSYHGVGGTANTNQFRLDVFSEEDGGASINVAPQGWGHANWPENHFVPFNFDDSVVVFDQVLDRIAADYCVDLNRVFVIGNSNGGQMAFHLGCVRGDRIRAIVPNGGRCFSYGTGLCDPYNGAGGQTCAGDVMVLSVMGEDDTTRHADEEASREGYRVRQGCNAETEAREPEPCLRYTGCNDGGEVAYCRIPGLRHGLWTEGRRDMYDYMMSL